MLHKENLYLECMEVTELFYAGLKYLWFLLFRFSGTMLSWNPIHRWLALKELAYLCCWAKWGHYELSTLKRGDPNTRTATFRCQGEREQEAQTQPWNASKLEIDWDPKPNTFYG